MNLYNLELNWIQKLQDALRSPLLDGFFIGWNYVDTFGFVLILITLVWYLIDRKIGIKMLYLMILSGVLNKLFKGVFDLPRPCQMDPSVGLLCFDTPGLPSGAAQSAMIYAGIILIECKKKIYWLWGGIFALLLCFSRVYLGLHFFTDILGGMVIGAVLVLIYWKLFPRLENYWKQCLFLFPLLVLLLIPKITLPFFWMSVSTGIGLWLYDKKEKKKGRIMQAAIVVAGLILCLAGMAFFPKYMIMFVILCGFWLSYLGPQARK